MLTKKKDGNVVLITLIVAGAVILSSLGTWQVYRLNWKLNLIEQTKKNMNKEPVNVSEVETVNQTNEYTRVTAKGKFLNQYEKHFLATHNSQAGFFIFTPLELSDNKNVVFVNRGFVTPKHKNNSTRINITNEVTVSGLMRAAPNKKPNRFIPDNDIHNNVYYWKSLSDMKQKGEIKKNVLPFFIDADDTPNPQGRPKGGVTIVKFNNPHLGYAITWFGLAITLIVVGTAFVRSRRKSK